MGEQILREYYSDVAERCYKRLTSSEMIPILSIKNKIREGLANFLRREEFVEISPVIISPITDPLAHETLDVKINYYGHQYMLTKSMIFHKQMALLPFEKIFCFSPNIRFELKEKAKSSRHLVEFSQLDLEVRYASREKMMELGERMLMYVLTKIKKCCKRELKSLGRDLHVPSRPFKRISFEEAYDKYGEEYESILSLEENEPFWIIDFPLWKREFYDKEDESRKGYLKDMDLVYPEGHREGLSGGEREYEYNRIIKRVKKSGINVNEFSFYLEMVKRGLYPSAGFGIGVERLVKFICGIADIQYAMLFPKIPGECCI